MPHLTLTDAARQALKTFRDSKPWKGTTEERADKFADLHRGLCRAYDLETMLVRDDNPRWDESSLASTYNPALNHIVLRGKLSVVTYLFCFGGALNMTPPAAMAFAKQVFRHFFPRSAAGCREEGGLMFRA